MTDREFRQQEIERLTTCGGCGKTSDDVEERYSFGIYAGRYCVPCCSTFADHCGVHDGRQGDVTTLHEFEAGGWDAIDGESE